MFKKLISESKKFTEAAPNTKLLRTPSNQLQAAQSTFGSDDSKRAQILTRSLRKKTPVQGVTALPPRVASADPSKGSVPAAPPQAFQRKPLPLRKPSGPPPIPQDAPAKKPLPVAPRPPGPPPTPMDAPMAKQVGNPFRQLVPKR